MACKVLSNWHNLTDAECSRVGSASMHIALQWMNENLLNLLQQLQSAGISAEQLAPAPGDPRIPYDDLRLYKILLHVPRVIRFRIIHRK